MREVKLDRYEYLGVLQLDSIMIREMKEKVKSEYIRRVKNLLKLRKSIDIKTKKLMIINGGLHPRGNVDRLYLARKEE